MILPEVQSIFRHQAPSPVLVATGAMTLRTILGLLGTGIQYLSINQQCGERHVTTNDLTIQVDLLYISRDVAVLWNAGAAECWPLKISDGCIASGTPRKVSVVENTGTTNSNSRDDIGSTKYTAVFVKTPVPTKSTIHKHRKTGWRSGETPPSKHKNQFVETTVYKPATYTHTLGTWDPALSIRP